jgi:hypothetical protein
MYTTEITRYTKRPAQLTHWAQVTDEWQSSFISGSVSELGRRVVYLVISVVYIVIPYNNYNNYYF